MSAGWAACKAAPEGPTDVRLQRDSEGNVLIRSRRGDVVAVAHQDLPRLAELLAVEWWRGVDDTPLDTSLAAQVAGAWGG